MGLVFLSPRGVRESNPFLLQCISGLFQACCSVFCVVFLNTGFPKKSAMSGSHVLAKDATHESGGANLGLNVKSSYVYGLHRAAGHGGNR